MSASSSILLPPSVPVVVRPVSSPGASFSMLTLMRLLDAARDPKALKSFASL